VLIFGKENSKLLPVKEKPLYKIFTPFISLFTFYYKPTYLLINQPITLSVFVKEKN